MVPMEWLPLEDQSGKQREDRDGDNLLNDFQLHQTERATVADKADAVSRHLTAVLKEGQSPRYEDNHQQGCVVGDGAGLLQLEVPIPGKGHEDVADNEQ